MKKILFFVFLLFILSTKNSVATPDILINEFSSDTPGNSQDPDWVEIYNSGSSPIDLSLYRLRDSSATNKKDLSGTVEPNGFAAFDWSDSLNKSGDVIRLVLKSDESITIDQVAYGSSDSDVSEPSTGQSGGRQTDGAGNWVIFGTPSKNATNNNSTPFPSPTPTLEPTPSSLPSPTPTPKSSSPTTSTKKSPSPTPLKTPTPSVSPSSSPQVLGQKDLAQGFADLAASDILNSPSPSPSTYENPFNKNISKILIASGAVFIVLSFGLYLWYKRSLGLGSNINKGNERFEQKEEE